MTIADVIKIILAMEIVRGNQQLAAWNYAIDSFANEVENDILYGSGMAPSGVLPPLFVICEAMQRKLYMIGGAW